MSTVKTNNVQIGQSATATNNFTWYQPASPDGTVRLGNGNAGAVTDRVTVTSAGNVGVGVAPGLERLAVKSSSANASTFAFGAYNSNGAIIILSRSDGLLGTGTLPNAPYNIALTGRTMVVNSDGNVGYVSSVRASKTNIQDMGSAEWVLRLKPVSFNYRKQTEDYIGYTDEFYDEVEYGLIAEDVEQVDPNVAMYNANTGKLEGVKYHNAFIGVLKLVQEQQALIEELRTRLAAVEGAIA